MTARVASVLFIGEGTSDRPLVDVVADLLLDHGIEVRITAPDLTQLSSRVGHATDQKIAAAMRLFEGTPDLLVVHRDADAAGPEVRRREVVDATSVHASDVSLVPIVPVRMTESWLLFDEMAIRQVAGNPRSRDRLDLRRPRDAEGEANPKDLLRAALVAASATTGRRRETVIKRFPEHRRQLLERLDRSGPVTELPAFQRLVDDVESAVARLRVTTVQ